MSFQESDLILRRHGIDLEDLANLGGQAADRCLDPRGETPSTTAAQSQPPRSGVYCPTGSECRPFPRLVLLPSIPRPMHTDGGGDPIRAVWSGQDSPARTVACNVPNAIPVWRSRITQLSHGFPLSGERRSASNLKRHQEFLEIRWEFPMSQ